LKKENKRVTVIQEPTLSSAEATIAENISEHKGFIIIGFCEVDYKGRANSKLESGDRIVIVKEDGAVLVHRPTDYSPVNWQPPGCLFEMRRVKSSLLLRAVRRKPREVLEISFRRIYTINSLSIIDRGDFYLYASEEDMQKAISMRPGLVEKGLKVTTLEKRIEPGFVDICGIDKKGRLVIIEIKRKTAGKDAALQLSKYVESMKTRTEREIRGILVAPEIAKDVQPLLATLNLEFKPLSPKKCSKILGKSKTTEILDYLEEDSLNKKDWGF
jgi:RecB family endonuclease NucS